MANVNTENKDWDTFQIGVHISINNKKPALDTTLQSFIQQLSDIRQDNDQSCFIRLDDCFNNL